MSFKGSSLVSTAKAAHLSASNLKEMKVKQTNQKPDKGGLSSDTKGIEDEQIHNLQQQIQFMELEVKLLQEKEKERESLTGLELTDGQPLNEHMIQLKAKQMTQQQNLQKTIKEGTDRVIELDRSNQSLKHKLKTTNEEKDKLKEKFGTAKEQIKKEREEFRSKYDKAYDDLERYEEIAKKATLEQTDSRKEISDLKSDYKKQMSEAMERDEKSGKLTGEFEQAIKDKDREIAGLQTKVKAEEVDLQFGESYREALASQNSLNLDLEKFKLEMEQSLSKVKQMNSIKQIMENQLAEANEEMIRQRTKTNNLETKINAERASFDERYKKALNQYEINMIFEYKQRAMNTERKQYKNFFEKGRIEEEKLMAEITKRIKSQTERDSLRMDFERLKEREQQQALEIQKLKHSEREVKLASDEKAEQIDSMEHELNLNRNKVKSLTEDRNSNTREINNFRKEASLQSEFKNIDMEDLKMIQQTNVKMSNNMERFLNKMDNF